MKGDKSERETIHKDINSHMKISRYGVELAYALIAVALFKHNENIHARKEGRSAAPIIAYKSSINKHTEEFGLCPKPMMSQTSTVTVSSHNSKVEMATLTYKEIWEILNYMDIGSFEIESLEAADVTSDEAFTILTHAISAYYVSSTLSKLSTTASFDNENAFFMSFLSIAERLTRVSSYESDIQQLGSQLASWNLKKVSTPGDGNCLFRSVAVGLIHRLHHGDKDIEQVLLGLGVPRVSLNDVEYLQRLLRTLMVNEWQEHTDNYQGYLTEDLAPHSETFLQSGHYTGDLGDLMILTLANVLHIPITVFTSISNMPVLCVLPTTTQSIHSTQPIFLAFTQSGPGHYDAVVSAAESSNPSAEEWIKCYCGRKQNTNAESCISMRCPCLRKKKECTQLCRCKSCNNEHGTRPPPSATRKRRPYTEQRQPLEGSRTETFLKEKGEDINKGHLTMFEDLLLKSIIVYFILHGLCITAGHVFNVYQGIFHACQLCESITFPLLERSERCVAKFLLRISIVVEFVKSVFKK